MKILVVTGSSGGHIFPALSFLETLKAKHPEIKTLLVLPKRRLKYDIVAPTYKVRYISVAPLSLRFNFSNFVALLRFLKGTWQSLIILFEFNPDLVVGFGSIHSLPLVMLAWLFRIRTLIHEQNALPGRANKILASFVDRVALSFAETKDYFKKHAKKLVLTGNPLRREFKRIEKEEALAFFGFEKGKFIILVMGGSQGSYRINSCFLKAMSTIRDRDRFGVIHISGAKDSDLLTHGYKDLNFQVRLFDFLNQIHYAYSVADLVISRAGATTIAELLYFKLPAIVIPYPFAYRHQLHNAEVLERKGCAILIKDRHLHSSTVRWILDDLMANPDKIQLMRSGYKDIPETDARDLLLEAALSLF